MAAPKLPALLGVYRAVYRQVACGLFPALMTDFVNAMSAALTGVTVVTTAGPIGRTVSAMCSVSAEPALLLVAVRSTSPLRAAIARNGTFTVHVLGAGQSAVADAFAGRGGEPDFAALDDAAAHFDCDVAGLQSAGTHTVILGAVRAARHGDVPALGYSRRAYCHIS
jgi:flavin reductase